MKKVFVNILITIFYLYGLVVLTCTPYFNWKYAKTHGVMEWILLGEVVATAKSFVWPYHMFFSDNKNNDSSDALHYNNSKRAFHKVLMKVNSVDKVLDLQTEVKAEIVELLKLAIVEAEQVKPSYLQEIHIDYPDIYKNKYIHGMRLTLEGIETNNEYIFSFGASETNSFSDWHNELVISKASE